MQQLLKAQFRRTLGLSDVEEVKLAFDGIHALSASLRADSPGLASVMGALETLFNQVGASYEQHDRDLRLLQRSLALTSEELLTANERLQHELARRSRALDTLQQALAGLLNAGGEGRAPDGESDIELVALRLADLAAERERMRAELQEGEQRYRTLFDGIIDAMFVCEMSADGTLEKFLEVNEVTCARLGYTREEFLALPPRAIDCPGTAIDTVRLASELQAGRSLILEQSHLTKDGRAIPVEIHAKMFHLLGRPAVLCLARDITQRLHSEEQLRLWPKVFNASRDGILITDHAQRVLSINRAVSDITGYAEADILGRTPRRFLSKKHAPDYFRALWSAIGGDGHWQGEIVFRRKNGDILPIWLSISVVRNPSHQVTHYIASFADITERKASQEQIRFLAYHDVLTGLPNRLRLREHFEHEIAHALRAKSKLALMFLDLDHFKLINDSLGHLVGDKLLQATSLRLKNHLRDTDIISRQGGDEFVILLPDRNNTDNLAPRIQGLMFELGRPFDIDGYILNVSTSIGVSIFPDDGHDFNVLLKNADTAMFKAKEEGRGTFRYFDELMNVSNLDRITIEAQLRDAIAREELSLHYQPQVSLSDGRIVGAEALLRWNSPVLGQVAPCRFIPIAEASGQIAAIGDWVLGEACRQAGAWQRAGHDSLIVAVNISAVQFKRGNLVESVTRALAQSGLDPACLELELTESLLIQDAESILVAVQRLKGLGVRLSIDDFGTGYSSLSYLKRFAVGMLKIDQSFVRGLPSPDDAAIVRAIITMAHSLGMSVIAEGVETEEQADFLREEGCDMAQGYLFGRPVPPAELIVTSQPGSPQEVS
ncbi:MAG: EAL domain-containing protein [Massilia sp.]